MANPPRSKVATTRQTVWWKLILWANYSISRRFFIAAQLHIDFMASTQWRQCYHIQNLHLFEEINLFVFSWTSYQSLFLKLIFFKNQIDFVIALVLKSIAEQLLKYNLFNCGECTVMVAAALHQKLCIESKFAKCQDFLLYRVQTLSQSFFSIKSCTMKFISNWMVWTRSRYILQLKLIRRIK